MHGLPSSWVFCRSAVRLQLEHVQHHDLHNSRPGGRRRRVQGVDWNTGMRPWAILLERGVCSLLPRRLGLRDRVVVQGDDFLLALLHERVI